MKRSDDIAAAEQAIARIGRTPKEPGGLLRRDRPRRDEMNHMERGIFQTLGSILPNSREWMRKEISKVVK